MDETIRFSISLPKSLLKELDEKMIKKGYASRSEFVRDLIRKELVEEKWSSTSEEVYGVLTIIYDHHKKELAERLIDIQHDWPLNIVCTTHIHMDHHNCLENTILRGIPESIEEIAIKIGGLNGVKFSKLTRAASIEK
ncbi:MAG: nickel-responsive transcriptional regulator NikR [Desulfurella sp.]|uniref:nickel-responsive transcriptional regulator NikR n=1 Tax=Desulfurella sp. TaxID=1962857 RepID=UPI0003E09CBB|nr:NAD+ synthetase [Desulfurella acetivorans A63]